MKFYAKVLVDVEIEADTEEYAEKLLSEDSHKLHLDVQGCSVDHGCFSLKSVSQEIAELIISFKI